MLFKRKACYCLIGFFYLFALTVFARDQQVADSLVKIYQADTLKDVAKFELLRNLSFNEVKDLKLSLQYADELINLSGLKGNYTYLFHGYFQKGNKKRLLGDLDQALDAYFKSAEAGKKANSISLEGSAYGAIADIYAVSKNHNNAMLYYHKAIATLRQSKDTVALASYISNAGDEFLNNKNYDSAILYFNESRTIFEKVNYLIGKAYSLGNIGMVYANIGENNLAEKNMNEAIPILGKLEDYYPICVYLISISDFYLKKEDERTALNYAMRSLKLAQQYKLKEQISDANLKLSELYEKAANPGESFKYYNNHIVYRDSVNNVSPARTPSWIIKYA